MVKNLIPLLLLPVLLCASWELDFDEDFANVPSAFGIGGDITKYTIGGTNYTAHIFTNSATFTAIKALSVESLIIAGGGGGGYSGATAYSGAGGAGGLIITNINLSATSYTITIGLGGIGGTSDINATSGSNTVFNSITAIGGGRGGTWSGEVASNGGSGGGARLFGTAGNGTTGQGFAGAIYKDSPFQGGVGGGSAGAGLIYPNLLGGQGTTNNFSGISVVYASGGGRGEHRGNALSFGDGGSSANPNVGGNGGSGIVIIRYRTN